MRPMNLLLNNNIDKNRRKPPYLPEDYKILFIFHFLNKLDQYDTTI